MKQLHIFGQPAWHNDAFIAGNREALVALRNAIDRALDGSVQVTGAYVNDGEGFNIFVLPLDDKQLDCLIVPYTDADAILGSVSSDAKRPDEFISKEAYENLSEQAWKNDDAR